LARPDWYTGGANGPAITRPIKHPKTGIFVLRKRVPDELRSVRGKREESSALGRAIRKKRSGCTQTPWPSIQRAAGLRPVVALPDITTSTGLLWPISKEPDINLVRVYKDDEGGRSAPRWRFAASARLYLCSKQVCSTRSMQCAA